MLAQRDEIAFVQLVCFTCQIQTLALVTGVQALGEEPIGGGEAGAASSAEASENEPFRAGPAITEDDVLEMHAFLAKYDGGIEGLLSRPDEDAGDDRGSSSSGEGSAG